MDVPDGTAASGDTREAIMEATFRALSQRGYKDLRLRDIGEELGKTRQVIHYHFDGKYDLMSSFLEYVIEQYEGSVAVDESDDPYEELVARIDQCLFGPDFEEFGHWDRMKVYHELFAYAQHDERHQETFNEHYEKIRGSVVEVVRRGIEEGAFRQVDPHATAETIYTAMEGARTYQVTLGADGASAAMRDAIEEFVVSSLRAA